MRRDFKPVHPGVILKEIIKELGVSQARLAHDIGVSPRKIFASNPAVLDEPSIEL